MTQHVSKSAFKPKALEYFRRIERTGEELVITDRGRAVLKITRVEQEPDEVLRTLRGSVLRFDEPTEPVGLEDWEALSS